MKFRKYGLLMLFGCFFLAFSVVGLAEEKLAVTISALKIRPGEIVRVAVANQPKNQVNVSFNGLSKRLQEVGEKQIGLIATSFDTVPGKYTLEFGIVKFWHKITQEYIIEVVPRQFPEDWIKLPESTRKTILKSENVEADEQKIALLLAENIARPLLPLWQKIFIAPTEGRVTTEYGLARFVNGVANGRHSGIDLANCIGTPVYAVNNAKVVFAGNMYQTGLTVVLYHGLDLFTSYGHLSALKVKEGDEILRGTKIGLMGSTGLSTGSHLHFTVRVNSVIVDPEELIDHELSWEKMD